MRITRMVNVAIGVLTLVASLLASVARSDADRSFGPSLLLTSAIFGFVAVTLATTWRRRPAPGGTPMSAGLVWLVLLILTTVSAWDLIPADRRPLVGLLLAVIVGVTIGTAAAPNVDLGPGDEDRGGQGARRW